MMKQTIPFAIMLMVASTNINCGWFGRGGFTTQNPSNNNNNQTPDYKPNPLTQHNINYVNNNGDNNNDDADKPQQHCDKDMLPDKNGNPSLNLQTPEGQAAQYKESMAQLQKSIDEAYERAERIAQREQRNESRRNSIQDKSEKPTTNSGSRRNSIMDGGPLSDPAKVKAAEERLVVIAQHLKMEGALGTLGKTQQQQQQEDTEFKVALAVAKLRDYPKDKAREKSEEQWNKERRPSIEERASNVMESVTDSVKENCSIQ